MHIPHIPIDPSRINQPANDNATHPIPVAERLSSTLRAVFADRCRPRRRGERWKGVALVESGGS
jgi:hypothetical protein